MFHLVMAKKKAAQLEFKMDKARVERYIRMVGEAFLLEAPDADSYERAQGVIDGDDKWYAIGVIAEFSPSVFRRSGDDEVMLAMRRCAPAFYKWLKTQ